VRFTELYISQLQVKNFAADVLVMHKTRETFYTKILYIESPHIIWLHITNNDATVHHHQREEYKHVSLRYFTFYKKTTKLPSHAINCACIAPQKFALSHSWNYSLLGAEKLLGGG
jgi:hypothetical protein